MSESPETPGRPDPTRVAELISTAVELTQEVERLAIDSGHQFVSLARAARRNRMMIWTLGISTALDVIITIVLGVVGAGVVNNSQRLDAVTKQINQDNTEQRKRALCPLYGIFKDSRTPQGRAQAPDKQQYDHAFDVIEQGYLVLGCDQFLKETGRDAW
jgi:hypothetical protein